MPTYYYRRGDGNEGNYPRQKVRLTDDECPFAALRALVLTDYIPRSRTRNWIAKHLETEGEAEYGVNAWVHEGPKGEQAFGAAWLTADLQPEEDDPEAPPLSTLLDAGACKVAYAGTNLTDAGDDTLRLVSTARNAPSGLKRYARHTLLARELRHAGEIQAAQAHEAKAQQAYDRLPAEMKW